MGNDIDIDNINNNNNNMSVVSSSSSLSSSSQSQSHSESPKSKVNKLNEMISVSSNKSILSCFGNKRRINSQECDNDKEKVDDENDDECGLNAISKKLKLDVSSSTSSRSNDNEMSQLRDNLIRAVNKAITSTLE